MKSKEKVSESAAATPAQKKKFNEEKEKQVEPDQELFNPDADEDTTGKSEAFTKKELNIKKPGK